MITSDLSFGKILAAASLGSRVYFEHVVEHLQELWNLKAISYWCINRTDSTLELRAQRGFDYGKYRSFVISMSSCAGRAASSNESQFIPDLSQCKDYVDTQFIPLYKLGTMWAWSICIPSAPPNDNQQVSTTQGVICLYPNSECGDSHLWKPVLDKISPIIAFGHASAVSSDKTAMRKWVIQSAYSSHDLNSFYFKVLKALVTNIGIEAGSIYIRDKNNLLRLFSTTGLASKDIRRSDVYFQLNDKSIISKCFSTGTNIIIKSHSEYAAQIIEPMYEEETASEKRNCIVLPITIRRKNEKAYQLGCVKILNRHEKLANVDEVLSFGADTIDILEYLCEMLSVISQISLGAEFKFENFSSVLHGFDNALMGLRSHLVDIEQSVGRDILANHDCSLVYGNCLKFVDNLLFQHDKIRFDSSSTYAVSAGAEVVELGSDVFVHIKTFVAGISGLYNIEDIDVSYPLLHTIPRIKGNKAALLFAFKNLAENSVKYSSQHGSNMITITCQRSDNGMVIVLFTDTGIGIPDADQPMVFVPWYRSKIAKQYRPTAGTGIGLSLTKAMIESCGGAIVLKESSSKGTTFQISLREA